MDILQINTFDQRGGAAKVARDLHQRFRGEGHQSRLAVGWKQGDDGDVTDLSEYSGAWGRSWRSLEDRFFSSRVGKLKGAWRSRPLFRWAANPMLLYDWSMGHEPMRFDTASRLVDSLNPGPDIIHGHNLHGGYFDLHSLVRMSSKAPVVLTLHDAWALSGHCAHSLGCERWKNGCGDCPDLTLDPAVKRDATARNWRVKQDIYNALRAHIVTPSKWLMDKVDESILRRAATGSSVIHNGVDTSVFYHGPSGDIRQRFGLMDNDSMVLFAAEGLTRNRWKDFRTIKESLRLLSERTDQKVVCVALGEEAEPEIMGSVEIRYVGYLPDAEDVAEYFRAADVYLHASKADTFPNSVIEALACGTPVIATAVGGIPEQVVDGETGFLAPESGAESMAVAMVRLLGDAELRQRMSHAAAVDAENRFDLATQARKYLDLYEKIIAERRLARA